MENAGVDKVLVWVFKRSFPAVVDPPKSEFSTFSDNRMGVVAFLSDKANFLEGYLDADVIYPDLFKEMDALAVEDAECDISFPWRKVSSPQIGVIIPQEEGFDGVVQGRRMVS